MANRNVCDSSPLRMGSRANTFEKSSLIFWRTISRRKDGFLTSLVSQPLLFFGGFRYCRAPCPGPKKCNSLDWFVGIPSKWLGESVPSSLRSVSEAITQRPLREGAMPKRAPLCPSLLFGYRSPMVRCPLSAPKLQRAAATVSLPAGAIVFSIAHEGSCTR